MKCQLLAFVFVSLFVCASYSFKLSETVELAKEGFKQVVNKFGEKYWHRNHTDSEEVILS
jgi:hypothetical protein